MSKIKTIAIVSLFIFIIGIIGLYINNNKLKEELSLYSNNLKALYLENQNLENKAIAYKFDIEQLEYLNDSIINDLNNTRKELKIKDKQLLQMQSIKTEVSTKDSIFIKDTIFRDNFVKIDTTLGDEWYKVKLQLEYPSTIKVETKYKSDLNVFAYSSKEIIGTPKKCFIGRMFQKKHKLINVEVVDKNPYAIVTNKKFIIIE